MKKLVGATSAAIEKSPMKGAPTAIKGRGTMDSRSNNSRNLRKGRVSLAGQTYLVTSVTLNRQPIFTDYRLGRVLVNVMCKHVEAGHADNLAFVIMPDHFHWLFTLTEECSLSKLMGQVKGATAYQIGQIIAHEGTPTNSCRSGFSRESTSCNMRIWQKGFTSIRLDHRTTGDTNT